MKILPKCLSPALLSLRLVLEKHVFIQLSLTIMTTSAAHFLSQPPTRAHKEFAFSLFQEKKITPPASTGPSRTNSGASNIQLRPQLTQAFFRVPSPNYSRQGDRPPAGGRRAASPSRQDPGTAPPRGAARGSALWGPSPPPPARPRAGVHLRRGRAPPPHPGQHAPAPQGAKGQGYCRTECGHIWDRVFALGTPVKAGPRRAAGTREPQLLPEARR